MADDNARTDRPAVYFAADREWKAGPCKACGQAAAGRLWLYVVDPPPELGQDEQQRTVGEAYLHADKDDCIYPPALAADLRSRDATRDPPNS